MGLPVLFEIDQELTRLFVAGSRLSTGDAGVRKYIPAMEKLGERVPVFKKLASLMKELTESKPEESASKLIETRCLLLAVISTQGENASGPNLDSWPQGQIAMSDTTISSRELAKIIEALTTSGSGRLEIVKSAHERHLFNDPRTHRALITGLGDKFSELSDYISAQILPTCGEILKPHLERDMTYDGGAPEAKRLRALHRIDPLGMVDKIKEIMISGSVAMKEEAARLLGNHPECGSFLLDFMNDKKKEVREAVMASLISMNNKDGIDKILEMLNTKKAGQVTNPIINGNSPYLVIRLIEMARNAAELIESNNADKSVADNFYNLVTYMENKNSADIADFLITCLDSGTVKKASRVLSEKDDKKQTEKHQLELTVFNIIHYIGLRKDYIWNYFLNHFDEMKSKKWKPDTIAAHAFEIGIEKLGPEEFFDTFIDSGIYDKIAGITSGLFQNTFRIYSENPVPFSRRFASYFLEARRSDIYLTLATLYPDDKETLKKVIKVFKDTIKSDYYRSYVILSYLGRNNHPDYKDLFEFYKEKSPYKYYLEELETYLPENRG
ncbi:hypothetical protein KKF34_12665 [Myxococcota bacterium]|nr:hypothetical protein [Myxococcota bacterium]MBU1382695.1 hypothetical protein [Myxococcota bacterium]MBU1497718.1 hypothetical protein [Myxococcota bacterium]